MKFQLAFVLIIVFLGISSTLGAPLNEEKGSPGDDPHDSSLRSRRGISLDPLTLPLSPSSVTSSNTLNPPLVPTPEPLPNTFIPLLSPNTQQNLEDVRKMLKSLKNQPKQKNNFEEMFKNEPDQKDRFDEILKKQSENNAILEETLEKLKKATGEAGEASRII